MAGRTWTPPKTWGAWRVAAVSEGAATARAGRLRARAGALLPGVAAVAIIAAAAWMLGRLIPLIGAPVLALAAGVAIRNTAGLPAVHTPGVEYTLKRLLRLAIVLFGATLALGEVVRVGAGSLAVIVATIFLFNMLAVVVYPLLGHVLGLTDRIFGVWAGAAIHDTSSVLAASYAFSDAAGQVATVVKLTRTLMLVPLALAVGIVHSYARSRAGAGGGVRVDLVRIFPWFILWFVAAAGINTLGLLPEPLVRVSGLAGKFLIVMVMAAVGFGADLRGMRQIGLKPFYIGLAASVLIAVASMVLIRLLF